MMGATVQVSRPPHPPRPSRCVVQYNHVLDFLISRPHWLMWRYKLVWDEKKKAWKWTKPPYQPTRLPGSSTDPGSWSDWESIQIAYDRDTEGDKFFDGIGFALTADLGLVGWDFDHCYDSTTGNVDPTVARFLRILNSYCEVTPGGDGFRVFTFGRLPAERRKRGNFPQPGLACECYSDGRYLTITGHRFGDATGIIGNQAGIDEVHHAIFGEMLAKREATRTRVHTNGDGSASIRNGRSIPSDQDLLECARKAANGQRFATLYDFGDWNGAGYASHSEADVALCGMLAFYAGADPNRIDNLFRGSSLYREKWNRDDYRASTIARALDGRTEFYTGARPPSGDGWDDVREKIHSGGNDSPPPPDVSTRGAKQESKPEFMAGEPARMADHLRDTKFTLKGARTLHHYRDDFLLWNGSRFTAADGLSAFVGNWLADEVTLTVKVKGGGVKVVGPTSWHLSEVLAALKYRTALPSTTVTPSWLDKPRNGRHVIALANGLFDLVNGELFKPNPNFFNLTSLPVSYRPEAECKNWLEFLSRLWPQDEQTIETLQQMMGYFLGRVENWRAHRRRRVSSHSLSIEWWVHSSAMATFPVPAASNGAGGFAALRFPVRFAPRVMRPIRLGALSASS